MVLLAIRRAQDLGRVRLALGLPCAGERGALSHRCQSCLGRRRDTPPVIGTAGTGADWVKLLGQRPTRERASVSLAHPVVAGGEPVLTGRAYLWPHRRVARCCGSKFARGSILSRTHGS